MNRLIIVGAGGFGREVYSWVQQTPNFLSENNISSIAFVDNNSKALMEFTDFPHIVGDLESFQPTVTDFVICAIGNPFTRQKVVETLRRKGASFLSFIHCSAIVGLGNFIGDGVIICPNVVITTNVKLGNFVILNVASTVGHDAQLGDYVTLSAHCDITGGVQVGSYCQFGTSVRVIPGVKIGEDVKVGAGSVVIRNVESRTAVFGFPAKKIPRRG